MRLRSVLTFQFRLVSLALCAGSILLAGCCTRLSCEDKLKRKLVSDENKLLQFGVISKDYSILLQEQLRIAKLSTLNSIPRLFPTNSLDRSVLAGVEERIRKFSRLEIDSLRRMFEDAEANGQQVYWVKLKTRTNSVSAYVLYGCFGEPEWILSSEEMELEQGSVVQ